MINNTLETIVGPKGEHRLFDEMMGDLHYLGSARPAGDFLRQAVVRNGEWVGWYAAQRQKLVVQNQTATADPNLPFSLRTWKLYRENKRP